MQNDGATKTKQRRDPTGGSNTVPSLPVHLGIFNVVKCAVEPGRLPQGAEVVTSGGEVRSGKSGKRENTQPTLSPLSCLYLSGRRPTVRGLLQDPRNSIDNAHVRFTREASSTHSCCGLSTSATTLLPGETNPRRGASKAGKTKGASPGVSSNICWMMSKEGNAVCTGMQAQPMPEAPPQHLFIRCSVDESALATPARDSDAFNRCWKRGVFCPSLLQ